MQGICAATRHLNASSVCICALSCTMHNSLKSTKLTPRSTSHPNNKLTALNLILQPAHSARVLEVDAARVGLFLALKMADTTNVPADGQQLSIATSSEKAASVDMARSGSDGAHSSGSSSSSDTVGGDDIGDTPATAIDIHPPTSSLSAAKPDHIPISRTSLSNIENASAFELSPGPSTLNFQLDSSGEANSLSVDKSAFYGIAGSFNDSKGGMYKPQSDSYQV